MLEIRNVTKVYRSKTGEEVRALDNVSVTFPEAGMVFILGKSGSGKSTLLNIMGGLDSYDSGEFIIKGKSSKDFVGSDFDAYRNTFIGFIFQEYNVLDDFTVGANIGLALELQGKKATDEAINGILAQVDLLNYAKRKPNELSGGQKQRVAIARALVKAPEIIMADEPTGALDSNTGKQIFDTLKELSKTKLVLVVSHDRDFAERYADRIIEMSDGKVIEDVTKHEHQAERVSDGVHRISNHILRIEKGYRLTAKDLEMINDYLAQTEQDVLLSGDGRVNEELRSAAGISKDGGTTVFEGTDPEKDVRAKQYDKAQTKFIRSRLPMKNAAKMGVSGLKHKTFRLVVTIILSLVAFGMFGLADTLAAYNKVTAASESIANAENLKAASFALYLKSTRYSDGKVSYYYDTADSFNEQDLALLKEKTGLDFLPVFTGSTQVGRSISISSHFLDRNKTEHAAYSGGLSGLVSLTPEQAAQYGLSLVAGEWPAANDEIVITEHIYQQLAYYGYQGATADGNSVTITDDSMNKEVGNANSVLGKTLDLQIGMSHKKYTIVGVMDTHFDNQRYADFLPAQEGAAEGGSDDEGGLMQQLMLKELMNTLSYDFHCLGVLSDDAVKALAPFVEVRYKDVGTYLNGMNVILQKDGNDWNSFYMVAGSSALSDMEVQWFDGTVRTTLGEKEVLISQYAYNRLMESVKLEPDYSVLYTALRTYFGEELYAELFTGDVNYNDAIWQALGRGEPGQFTDAGVVDALLPAFAEVFAMQDFGLENLPAEQKYQLVFYNFMGYLNDSGHISSYQIYNIRANAIVYTDVFKAVNKEGTLQLDADNPFVLQMNAEYAKWNGNGFLEEGDWAERPDEDKLMRLRDAYSMYLRNYDSEGYTNNQFGKNGRDLENESTAILYELCNVDPAEMTQGVSFVAKSTEWDKNGNSIEKTFATYNDWKIVGYYTGGNDSLLVSETFNTDYRNYAIEQGYSIYEYSSHESGLYSHVILPMPTDVATIRKLVELSYLEEGDVVFRLQNNVMDTLEVFNEFVEPASKIFVYVGLGFALFASFLLMNFISTSISYKKREIGILRAVGARSSDVFKIFFSEAAVIALINFALSCVAVGVATYFLNGWMHNNGIVVTLLSFGARQIVLMLGVSVLVAVLSSFFPVWKIARKKPVDAIKDR